MIRDVALEAVRVLFLLSLPLLVAVTLGGVLVGALQSATSVREPALGYAVRAIVTVLILYLLAAQIGPLMLNLAHLALS